MGEIRRSRKECYKCPAGKYAKSLRSSSCDNCPDNAICLGSNSIIADKGYWQISNRSYDVHDCGLFKPYCLGGAHYQYSTNPCSGGHFGPLCKLCDTTGQYY